MLNRMFAFDLVGTLIKSEVFHDARSDLRLDCNAGWNEAEEDVDFRHNFDYRAVIRRWLELEQDSLVETLFDQFKARLVDSATQEHYLYDEVIPVLQKLHTDGFRLGFVTDGPDEIEGEMIRQILSASDVPAQECIVVTGEMTSHPKDEVKPFDELIRMAGVGAENIVFVGDKPKADFKGPQKAGIEEAVLIDRSGQSEHTIKNLWETWDRLQELADNNREDILHGPD